MRLLLSPRTRPTYGQDFIQSRTERALRLVRVAPDSDGRITIPEATRLLVTHDLTYSWVARGFRDAPAHIARVAHLHLQWGYSPADVRDRVSEALTSTEFGITPSRALQLEMAARFPTVQWMTVLNGVDETRFRPTSASDRAAFRRRLNLPAETRLWAYVGRLESAKGLDILHSLVPYLAQSDAHLLIQFPQFAAPVKNEAQARLAEALCHLDTRRVHLVADVAPQVDDRPVRYCDLLVHPSLSEVAPLTWIEAWMSGVPVLATRSTTFCEEAVGLDLHLVDLPSDTSWSAIPQSQLRIKKAQACEVAARLAWQAGKIPSFSDEERLRLARSALDRGHSDRSMIRQLQDAYRRFER